MTKGKHTKSH